MQAKVYFYKIFLHSTGRLSDEEKTFIPESEWGTVYLHRAHPSRDLRGDDRAGARHLEHHAADVSSACRRCYGAWLYVTTGLTQHAGLAEDVLDHRLNCRTVYMNPIVRFLYWEMNYHVEHHMFPMVPYYNLKDLHAEMKNDTPDALQRLLGGLPGDHPGDHPAGEGALLLRQAAAPADRARLHAGRPRRPLAAE